jgi:hypothetical protein
LIATDLRDDYLSTTDEKIYRLFGSAYLLNLPFAFCNDEASKSELISVLEGAIRAAARDRGIGNDGTGG